MASSESIQQGIDVSLSYAADNGSLGDERQMTGTISGGGAKLFIIGRNHSLIDMTKQEALPEPTVDGISNEKAAVKVSGWVDRWLMMSVLMMPVRRIIRTKHPPHEGLFFPRLISQTGIKGWIMWSMWPNDIYANIETVRWMHEQHVFATPR